MIVEVIATLDVRLSDKMMDKLTVDDLEQNRPDDYDEILSDKVLPYICDQTIDDVAHVVTEYMLDSYYGDDGIYIVLPVTIARYPDGCGRHKAKDYIDKAMKINLNTSVVGDCYSKTRETTDIERVTTVHVDFTQESKDALRAARCGVAGREIGT